MGTLEEMKKDVLVVGKTTFDIGKWVVETALWSCAVPTTIRNIANWDLESKFNEVYSPSERYLAQSLIGLLAGGGLVIKSYIENDYATCYTLLATNTLSGLYEWGRNAKNREIKSKSLETK